MRRMLRVLPVLALLLAVVPGFAGRAQAMEEWCFDDPVISVNGRLVDIQVQMQVSNLLTMRSTTLTVIIPSNTTGAVLVDDVSAFPMRTTISPTGPAWNGRGGLPITVVASVSASTNYPIRVVARPLVDQSALLSLLSTTTAQGWANSVLSMPVTLG